MKLPKSTKKNILVTGGGGYVGSHCVLALKEAGYQPVILDNLSRGDRDASRFGRFIEGDCRDFDLLKTILIEHDIQVVAHLASYAYVEESIRKPQMYMENNLESLLSLLKAMKQSQVHQLIFASSCTVYDSQYELIREDSPLSPTSPYGLSKKLGEEIIGLESDWLQSVIFRLFNVAGADPLGRLGENHDPETHIIPRLLQLGAGHLDSDFFVYGTDFPTPDGTCIRDYVHVSDVASAHVLAVNHLELGRGSRVFNICADNGYSNKEICEEVQNIVGTRLAIKYVGKRPGDRAVFKGDCKAIQAEWGWEPTQSSLKNIIRSAWNWQKEHHSKSLTQQFVGVEP